MKQVYLESRAKLRLFFFFLIVWIWGLGFLFGFNIKFTELGPQARLQGEVASAASSIGASRT